MKISLDKSIVTICFAIIIFCVLLLASVLADILTDRILKPQTLYKNMIFSATLALITGFAMELFSVKIFMFE